MFGKLLKYEMKSNGRALFPIYCAGVGGALLLRLAGLLLGKIFPEVSGTIENFLSMPVWIYAIAVVVFSLGYVILRFYRSMVGREAYLTLTLPVGNTLHLAAKYISAIIFGLLGFAAAVLTVLAFTFRGASEFEVIKMIFAQYGSFSWLVVAAVLLFLMYFLMEAFLSCAVGGQTKNKAAGSLISYFVINNAVGLLMIGIFVGIGFIINKSNPGWLTDVMDKLTLVETDPALAVSRLSGFLWAVIGVFAAYCLIVTTTEFLAARYLMNKKVNLD